MCKDEDVKKTMRQGIQSTAVHFTLSGLAAAAIRKHQIKYSGERGQRHARVHGYPQAALNRPRADESIVGYCRAENEVSWLNNFKAYGRTRVDSSTLVHSRVSTWYM